MFSRFLTATIILLTSGLLGCGGAAQPTLNSSLQESSFTRPLGTRPNSFIDYLYKSSCAVLTPAGNVGSGIVFKRDGDFVYILTARHILSGTDAAATRPASTMPAMSRQFVIPVSDKSLLVETEMMFEAALIKESEELDLAVLKIYDAKNIFIAIKAFGGAPLVGDKVFTIGAPHALMGVYDSGETMRVFDDFINTNIGAVQGYSGGGIYNSNGEVIAITLRAFPNEMNLAVTYKKFKNFIENAR